MKRTLLLFLTFGALLFAFQGCEDNPTLTVLEEVSFTAPATSSTDNVALTEDDSTANVITLSWEKVDYPIDAPVTYSLQFTAAGDTSTWANMYEMEVGTDVYTATLTGKKLNTIATDELGLEPEVQSNMAIRVKSYVDRAAYSSPVTVSVTPYKVIVNLPSLWVAGDFQGWDIATAPAIVSPNDDGVYEGYIFIPPGGTNEFKIYGQQDWSPISYGTKNDSTVIEANYAGDNFSVPSDGYYLISIDLNKMILLFMKTDWGMIGGATPNGWDSDTMLEFNQETQSWSVTADMIADGSFKFRANQEWKLDLGLDDEGNLAYANHPWKDYVERPQLTVPEDGNYTIVLDLHEPGRYKYSITKN